MEHYRMAFFVGGWRWVHASLVIENDKDEKRFVVMGGEVKGKTSKSVLLMDLTVEKKEWIKGPSLGEARDELSATSFNGGVYVIGGWNGTQELSSIERIDVEDLLQFTFRNAGARWKTLNCRLSTARSGCAIAAVLDRFIVVVGGHDGPSCLSSVEIVDTFQHTVVAGPTMTVRRDSTSIDVVGDHIYVVGGVGGPNNLKTVEYLEFNIPVGDEESHVASVFGQSSSWKIDNNLTLSNARRRHALVQVDSCLIVAGGYGRNGALSSVEVLDTERRVVWSLPNMAVAREGCSMVAFPDCVVITGGENVDAVESFPLLSQRKQLMDKYSCRAELDLEIHSFKRALEQTNDVKTTSMALLQKAREANQLLPMLESLHIEPKFRSEHELQSEIETLGQEYNNAQTLEKQFVIFSMIQKNEKLLTENKEFGAAWIAGVRTDSMNAAFHDVFFTKLVDMEYVHVIAKLHELVPFVSDVHKMKIFYTFINHLYRSTQISDKVRRYYIVVALNNLAKNQSSMSQVERKVWKIILQKCTETGTQNIPVADEVNHDQESKEYEESTLLTNICHHVCAYEFRVGRLIPIPSKNTADQTEQRIMAHVMPLGGALNELFSAHSRRANVETAVAAICLILNACRQFTDVNQESQQSTKTAIALLQVVDFGDVAHIAAVVQSTGCPSLQRAWDEGIRIVESVTTLTGGCFLNDSPTDQVGSTIIVPIMGNLAIALKKIASSGSSEEATILSLAIASKLTQAMENCDDLSVPSKHQFSAPQFYPGQGDTKVDSKNTATLQDSAGSVDLPVLARPMSNIGKSEVEHSTRRNSLSAAVNQLGSLSTGSIVALSSWEIRMNRLEATIGMTQRIGVLEHMYGLSEQQGMTFGERLSRLEELFH